MKLEAEADHYGSLHAGDPCRVDGLRGQRFRFVRYARSAREEWVEVYGGKGFDPGRDKSGYAKLRCVNPHRLRTLKGHLP